ncbi:hypothetical protein VCB98_13390 [Gammaproteobacteria bacterium AB-CW1]|uniref:Phosphatidic acid phosphatase type 2/haloperoxidase domain-containing protein n=1 Tax=Natronospira elongata TaxID=3110268 RepID=A0AAP6JGW2_9GAMM|nr:hypothetical protein [Gammaproteobacteria bacterium AB-CW1]
MLSRSGQARPWRVGLSLLLTVLFGVFPSPSVVASEGRMDDLLTDQRNYYSKDRLLRLGVVFGVGGIAANTSFDERFQRHYQDRIRNAHTDEFSEMALLFAEGKYLIPVTLSLASLSLIDEDSSLGEFGGNTIRSYLVGAVPVFAMQRVTGASRPGESDRGSKWQPLADDNGVSGHAFAGAVPFLVAARTVENPFAKYALYAASLAVPFARVNDKDHYVSQAALGWYMAFEATGAVLETERNKRIGVAPMVGGDYYGIAVFGSW